MRQRLLPSGALKTAIRIGKFDTLMRDMDLREEQVIAYWLGRLSEEEQARLEQEYFADDEKYALFQAAQNDLLDAYVRDQLGAAERAAFERHLLATPWQRERVDFARALARRADRLPDAPAPSAEESPAWLQKLKALFWPGQIAGPTWSLAGLAAVLLCAVVGAWLWLNAARLRQELAVTQNQLTAEQQQTGQARERAAQLAKELERERAQRAQLEKEPRARAATPQPSSPTAGSILSFILTPPLFRDGGHLPRLELKPGVQTVRLQLKFSHPESFRAFSVEVETPDEKPVWRKAGLPARAGQDERQVTVALPAAALARGDYVVKLQGRTANGEWLDVASYPLRVTQP